MSLLGKILAVLNVLAVAAFAYLAIVDHGKRQAAAYSTFLFDQASEGLPVKEQPVDSGLPRDRYLARRPLDPDSPTLKDEFNLAGQPVNVQVKELTSLRNSFFTSLTEAARQAGSKDGPYKNLLALKPEEKTSLLTKARRAELGTINKKTNPAAAQLEEVLQLAPTGTLRLKLIDALQKAPNLGELLERIAVRRMLGQALLSLEERRPEGHREELALLLGDLDFPAKPPAELGEYLKALDDGLKESKKRILKKVSVDPKDPHKLVKEFEDVPENLSFDSRVDLLLQPPNSADESKHRQDIAYFLFSLSQVVKPDGTPLDNPSVQRVAVITGRKRLAEAIENQTVTFRHALSRALAQLQFDLNSFTTRYNQEIKDRFPSLQYAIQRFQSVVDDWEKQKEAHTTQRDRRKDDYEKAVKDLKQERDKATAALKELAAWQDKLFQAQLRGSGVLEENLKLEKKIVQLEKEKGR
jgi:hypothetical protein